MRPTMIDEPWTDTGTIACTDCGAESRDRVCPSCALDRNEAEARREARRVDEIAHYLDCQLRRYRIDGHAPGLAKAVEEAVAELKRKVG